MLLKETVCRECGEESLMRTIPTFFAPNKKQKQEKRSGKAVEEFISETREAVKREKEDMQKDFEC